MTLLLIIDRASSHFRPFHADYNQPLIIQIPYLPVNSACRNAAMAGRYCVHGLAVPRCTVSDRLGLSSASAGDRVGRVLVRCVTMSACSCLYDSERSPGILWVTCVALDRFSRAIGEREGGCCARPFWPARIHTTTCPYPCPRPRM